MKIYIAKQEKSVWLKKVAVPFVYCFVCVIIIHKAASSDKIPSFDRALQDSA